MSEQSTAEKVAAPDQVGYSDPWLATEYGVFEDRRSKGLGFALARTTEDRMTAINWAKRPSEYPMFVRQRVVVYQPWARVTPPADPTPDAPRAARAEEGSTST